MPAPRTAVLAALLPFAVSAVVLLVGSLRSRAREGGGGGGGEGAHPRTALPFTGGLAVAAGFVAGYVALLGAPPWPPISSEERLVFLAPAAALAGLAALRARALGHLVSLALSLGGAWWMLESARTHRWSGTESATAVLGFGLAATALGIGAGALARRRPGPLTPGLWTATGVAASICILLSQNAKTAQLAGALASALAAGAAVALLRRRLVLSGGATAVAAVVLVGLLLHATVYGEVAWSVAALLAAAPLVAAAAELPAFASLPPRRHALLRVALTVLPLLAALLAGWVARPEPSPYDDY